MGASKKNLTASQIECLLLVSKQMTSKEIARDLGISPFTVDQRLGNARKILKAGSRREAAAKFMLMQQTDIYHSSVYKSLDVEKMRQPEMLREPVFDDSSPISEKAGNRRDPAIENAGEQSEAKLSRKLPKLGGQHHHLSKLEILRSILTIAFISTICLSALVVLVIGIMQILKWSPQ